MPEAASSLKPDAQALDLLIQRGERDALDDPIYLTGSGAFGSLTFADHHIAIRIQLCL